MLVNIGAAFAESESWNCGTLESTPPGMWSVPQGDCRVEINSRTTITRTGISMPREFTTLPVIDELAGSKCRAGAILRLRAAVRSASRGFLAKPFNPFVDRARADATACATAYSSTKWP